MSGRCHEQATGAIELYFYDELEKADRARFEQHLSSCPPCRAALDELRMIRKALAARPDVSSPPAGDWSGFMSGLDARIGLEDSRDRYSGDRYSNRSTPRSTDRPIHRRSYAIPLAMAALLALVTMSVFSVMRWRATAPEQPTLTRGERPSISATARHDQSLQQSEGEASPTAALAASSEQHFERSKLVLLGLTAKDADAASPEEWTYERELASSLLADTRLYRMAAEERGMNSLAGVLRDLEVVLLEASLTEFDRGALGQIQTLIRKRNLLEKMDVVTASGI